MLELLSSLTVPEMVTPVCSASLTKPSSISPAVVLIASVAVVSMSIVSGSEGALVLKESEAVAVNSYSPSSRNSLAGAIVIDQSPVIASAVVVPNEVSPLRSSTKAPLSA